MTQSGKALPADSIVQTLVAEYQKELTAGDTPTTLEYLERIADELKPALVEQLVPLEYAACFRMGWLPTVEDFKSRLPQHGDLVERVLLNTAGSQGHRYVLVRKLGQGQMGEVFLARDDIGRDVAIKVLKRAGGISEAAQRAFSEEITAMGRLGLHRNVVALYHKDILPDGREGSTAAVMQYVPGQTLREHLDSLWGRHKNAAVPDVVQFVLGIAHGLAHIQRGRLQAHRDLKPENVILDGSQSPLITDFGLATLLSKDRTAGTVRGGTPKYMAPEQVRHFLGNDREDLHNCDIWAVGVIFYEALTGELPFRGTGDELFANIECATPVPPRRLRDDPAFNAALEQICLKCLEKRPEDRYSTAADLRDALQAWLDAYQGTPKLLREIRDFTGVRQQYEHVTERRSITDQITRFLETNAKGLLVIKGPPGKGKSGIAVELERRLTRSGGHRPVAFYFRNRTANVDECVRHFYASLAIQHEISSPDTYRLPPEPDKAVKALRLLLRDIAGHVDSEHPQVIILDALDEAKPVGEGSNPYEFVNQLMAELPEHVYLVVTSRAVPELPTIECDAPHHELDLDNPDYLPQYRRDVRDYVERELPRLPGAGLAEPLLDQVAEIADGNFLVARLICNEVRERSGTISDTEALLQELLQEKGPNRLGRLYQRFVKRLWNHPRVGESVGGVLRVLSFAEADVTPTLIMAATGLQLEQWHAVREVLQEFLYIKPAEPAGVQEDRIRPFHVSFRDYLRNRVYHGDEQAAHRFLRTACVRWKDYTTVSRDYALRYALVHAIGAFDDQTIEKLLHDYAFLEAKADAGLIGSLKLDLDRVAERFRSQGNPASGLVQDVANAIWESIGFIERHPVTLFQCIWNALWWIDSPAALEWLNPQSDAAIAIADESQLSSYRRHKFVEAWREWKEITRPGFSWLRSTTPSMDGFGIQGRLEGHTDSVSSIDTTTDGSTALSASADGTICLWQVATASRILMASISDDHIDVIRFCHNYGDTQAFVGGGRSGRIYAWSVRDLSVLADTAALPGGITTLAVPQRSHWIAAGTQDGCVSVHETPSLRELARWTSQDHLESHDSCKVGSLAIDASDNSVVFTIGGNLIQWNWLRNTHRIWLAEQHKGAEVRCQISGDGRLSAIFYSADVNDPEATNGLAVLPLAEIKLLAEISGAQAHAALEQKLTPSGADPWEMRFAPEGDALIVADGATGRLSCWSSNGEFDISLGAGLHYGEEPRCLAFAGPTCVLAGTHTGFIRAVQFEPDKQRNFKPPTDWANSGVFAVGDALNAVRLFDPKGRYLVAANESWHGEVVGGLITTGICVGDMRRPSQPPRRVQVPGKDRSFAITCGAVSANGCRVVFGLRHGGLVVLTSPHDCSSDAQIVQLPWLLAADDSSLPAMLDLVGDSQLAGPTPPESPWASQQSPPPYGISAIAVSRFGGTVVAGTFDGRLTLLQDQPAWPWVAKLGSNQVRLLSLSGDETIAAAAVADVIHVVSVIDGNIVRHWENVFSKDVYPEADPLIPSVEFLRLDLSGNRVAIGCNSGWLRWFDITTGDVTLIGKVKSLADFSLLFAKAIDCQPRLARVDCDLGVVTGSVVHPRAWVPGGWASGVEILTDDECRVLMSLTGRPRIFVREGTG